MDVAPNIKVREWVSVVEKTDNNGHETMAVKPSAHKAAPEVATKTDHNAQ